MEMSYSQDDQDDMEKLCSLEDIAVKCPNEVLKKEGPPMFECQGVNQVLEK